MALLAAIFHPSMAANPVINIKGGQVQGVCSPDGRVISYKGIPYAAPPTGALRWRAPQDVIPWKGVRIADHFGNIAPQPDKDPNSFYGKEFYADGLPAMSEDCLYLNVWAPESGVGNPDAGLPVAMWIHGGAYSGGYGHEITMDGTAWAEKGVILVTINYRLGILGFLSHPALSAEQGGTSGNYGMMDQIAALRWIYDNIKAFGGDPENITVMGQSAGAWSVKTLVCSEQSKGMIAKAVIQSGGGIGEGAPGVKKDRSEEYGKKMFDEAGIKGRCKMRKLPFKLLMEKIYPCVEKLARKIRLEGGDPLEVVLLFSPHIDGKTMTKDFDTAVYDGTVADIPYLIGYVADDGEMLGGEGIRRFCYKRNSEGHAPAYSYLFTRGLPGDNAGSFHSSELWYTFHTLDRSWRPFIPADYDLSERMLQAWTDFCKTGDPGWRADTAENPYIQLFGIE